MPYNPKKPITESKSIRSVLKLISWNSVLLVDLDNTLMESENELGGDAWFTSLCCYAPSVINNKEQALAVSIALYKKIQRWVNTKPVEETTAKIIKLLQLSHVPIIAITARSQSIEWDTLRQLDKIKIKFNSLGIAQQPLFINNTNEKPALYSDGIIYCDGKDKGLCFKSFIEANHLKLKHVVMIDDKIHHLDRVKKQLDSLGVRFNGIHYTHLDEQLAEFNFNEAHEVLAGLFNQLDPTTQGHVHQLNLLPSLNNTFFTYREKKEILSAERLDMSSKGLS